MTTSYYDNPFDGDDDDACFADVEVEEIFIEEIPPREVMEEEEITPYWTRQNGITARPGEEKESSHSYHRPPSGARAESEFDEDVVRSALSTGGAGRRTGRTRELRLDEMSQSMSQLQRQMNAVSSSKNTMEEDYEEHIQTLRNDLENVSAERNNLLSAQARLESELRALRLEKDNSSFLYKQERERNDVLSQQVEQLQQELSDAQETHQRMLHDLHQTHQEELVRSARTSSPRGVFAPPSSGMRQPPQNASSYQMPLYSQQQMYEQEHPDEDDFSEHPPTVIESRPPTSGTVDSTSCHNVKARGKGNTTASSWTIGQGNTVSHAEKTEKEKEFEREKRMKEVEALETKLLEHSRNRDELSSQLTRLESSRVRQASERNKKALVEEKLQVEEKAIGQIRLKLRSMEALFR